MEPAEKLESSFDKKEEEKKKKYKKFKLTKMANECRNRKDGWIGQVEMSFVSNELMASMN